MKKNIAVLASKMQELFEKENGTLSGGFFSLRKNNHYPNPVLLNENNCVQDRSTNEACENHDCSGSNSGQCLNFISCVGTTNSTPTGEDTCHYPRGHFPGH